MTQPGGRQLAHMWALMTSALASAAADVRAEGHLATDAIVAFVDGELSVSAHERATRHLAHCPQCTAEVAAQRQASTAVRDAGVPAVPTSLLAALHNIPQSAPLPPGPEELAVTEDGQLVVVQRPSDGRLGSRRPLGAAPPLGSGRPLGTARLDPNSLDALNTVDSADTVGGAVPTGGRRRTARLAQGAGVVVSGLVLGALVLVAPTDPPGTETVPGAPRPAGGVGGAGGGSLPVNAELAPGQRRADTTPADATQGVHRAGAPALRAR